MFLSNGLPVGGRGKCMRRGFLCVLGVAALALGADNKQQNGKSQETVSKPLTEKQQRARQKKLEKELLGPYKKWLNEDVVYIITDEERQALKRLNTDEEREQ